MLDNHGKHEEAKLQIENEASFRAALTKGINLFLGAGFSVHAVDKNGDNLPTAQQLSNELRKNFELEHMPDLDLAKLCTVIKAEKADDLRNYLVSRFTVDQYDHHYHEIEKLNIETIFTTNIDDLIYNIFSDSKRYYINDADKKGPVFRDREAIDLYMLHGSVRDPSRPLRFGTLDVASSFSADPDRWYYLQTRLQRVPTIFWGYMLNDSATLEVFANSVKKSRGTMNAWILTSKDADSSITEYFKALELQLVRGNTLDLLKYISQHVPPQSMPKGTKRTTKELFPLYSIPDPSTVPRRPITEFYRGASPSWSDVFSDALFTTSHYRTILNYLESSKNVIITGVPACGKTTLLMQLAAYTDVQDPKILLNAPSRAVAELIARKLEHEPALVFLDDFTNDVEAFNVLKDKRRKIVATDRDYYLSMVKHLINLDKCEIVDVTELTRRDLQGCRQAIPESIRTENVQLSEMTGEEKPSLFEFVQANTTEPTLRERFNQAMRELRQEDSNLLEMLLFVSYVHSCRTPVSMDMALAYWKDDRLSYSVILGMVRDAGRILSQYEGDLADEPQDYFATRSRLIADVIIEASDQQLFHHMIKRFHRNLSPYRICHYHIFERRAYDAALIGKAFAAWKEGRDFYERIYSRDHNPYIRQQEAIFLGNKKRYSEAFTAIDSALAEAGSMNWTIRNSHAIILFRANIRFADRSDARLYLDESMDILHRCYTSDRRKAFHAMTFADHAIQYWDAYGDEKAESYLRLAVEWLEKQRKEEPWLKKLPYLLWQTRRRLN